MDTIKTQEDYLKIINAHREKRKAILDKFGEDDELSKHTDRNSHLEKMNPMTGRAMRNRGALKKRILDNPWYKKSNPSLDASKWFIQVVLKDSKKYAHKSHILTQGQLFTFEYKDPKNKDKPSLPYFDKFPLVLALGSFRTGLGVRNIGINLHYLPAKVRLIVLNEIYDLYRSIYYQQIKSGVQKPVPVHYKQILKHTKKYGVGFAIKMYIPQRQRVIIKFPYADWSNAIFLKSSGLYGIKADKMVKEWKKWVKNQGYSQNDKISLK